MDASEGAPPLSVAQEALWYQSLLAPTQISYNEAISIRKDGPFDARSFRRTFNEIVRRHEAWRTTFHVVGAQPVQVVQPPPDFELPVLDLSQLSFEEAERRAVELAAEASRAPYDLRNGPLLRPRLVRFPGEHHRLYLAMHHLVFDGVSVYRVVLPELVALYDAFCANEESPLPEPPTQYSDYARWEQCWIAGPRVARRLEHWRRHLTPTPFLSLPLDHRRPPTQRFRGGVVPLSLPAETAWRLREAGQRAGSTLFQVMATAWALLLGWYSGQDDVVFATATDLRQRPEFESVVGYSLTPLVLRIDLGGDPAFSDLVVRVRNELLDGLDNLVPFERLVRELHPDTMANANPIYQSMFLMEPPTVAPDPRWSIHQMESEIGDAVGSAKLDLELELDERPEGHVAGRLIYDRDLFEAATARRVVEQWVRLLATVAADAARPISEISIFTDQERRQLVEWNATTTHTAGSPAVLHALAEVQAFRRPDAPAVSAGGRVVRYGELKRQAGLIAGQLLAGGLGPGQVVAVCSEPSPQLVAGILGVLKAGAAYLLVAPEAAADRLDLLVADSGAGAILADPAFADRLTAPPAPVFVLGHPDDRQQALGRPPGEQCPPGVCCVHYRSSEEAGPNGVPIRHDSVVNLCRALCAELGIGSADTLAVLPSTLFRAHVLELWLPLLAGAKVVLVPSDIARDGARLSRLISDEGVSFLHASPSEWQGLIETGLRASRGLGALSGGEELSEELADQILDRCRMLWNAYGAPETTLYSTLGRVERSAPMTIGRPIANTRAYVLDARGQPVPPGVIGDLLIAGDGVAAGYLNRPESGAGLFLDEPSGSGRAFATGDRARWRVGGELELRHPVPRPSGASG